MRSSEGRPFQVEGPTTEKTRICLVEVRAKGTRRRPCWDERSDRELIALRGDNRVHVGRQEQGQLNSARPRKRSYMKSAAQQGASEEHQACIERHGQIYVCHQLGGQQNAGPDPRTPVDKQGGQRRANNSNTACLQRRRAHGWKLQME